MTKTEHLPFLLLMIPTFLIIAAAGSVNPVRPHARLGASRRSGPSEIASATALEVKTLHPIWKPAS